ILPHAAAENLVRITGLAELRLLRRNVAVHVVTGGIVGRPYAHRVFGSRVEIPDQLAGLRVIGADKAADTIFTAVGADQDLAVDGGRRHRLAIAERRIGDLGLPYDAAGLGIERDQLCIKGGEIDFVIVHGDAAVVRSAAIGGDRTHGVLVMPIFFAGFGVKR